MDPISEQTILTTAFPDAGTAIAALRLVDGEFDEICSDFVELARMVAATEGSQRIDDIIESIADLAQEIKSALKTKETTILK